MTQTRFIYILSNPITQEVFYVGCTSCIKLRRRQHFIKYASQFNGLPPVFTVIDFINSNCFWVGLALERYWINRYKHMGYNLINRRCIKQPDFNMDYWMYRKGIKESTVMDYQTIPHRNHKELV